MNNGCCSELSGTTNKVDVNVDTTNERAKKGQGFILLHVRVSRGTS